MNIGTRPRINLLNFRRHRQSQYGLATRSSTSRLNVKRAGDGLDLVGPSDPISNIRPVIYALPSGAGPARQTTSPYSASEFSSNQLSDHDNQKLGEDMADRLRKEAVDKRNHEFWATTNLLFEAHLKDRLSVLPPAPPPSSPQSELDAYAEAKEEILSDFYRDWVNANRERQGKWVWNWWASVREDIFSSLRKSARRLLG